MLLTTMLAVMLGTGLSPDGPATELASGLASELASDLASDLAADAIQDSRPATRPSETRPERPSGTRWAPAGSPASISARLVPVDVADAEMYQIQLEYRLDEGWTVDQAGLPGAILQIEAPAAVTLEGKVLTDPRELARNEFLIAPFERLIQPGQTTINLTLTQAPGDADRIALNVISYLRHQDTKPIFRRQRFELGLTANAEAQPVLATRSDWGGPHGGLDIGNRATPFELPRADGTTVALESYRGRRNVLVTTYRAFW